MESGTKIFAAASVGMALIIIVAITIDSQIEPGEDNDILDVCLQDHSGAALHYHVTLKIEVRGSVLQIPEETGIEPGCMRGIHTH
ncbi:MAG TPA: hypothetical protein EYQ80_06645, partial [Candidatus Poseidoniales archaeon]|nr:hypothetical protein [Candidatus Poseidoniales archaeon]